MEGQTTAVVARNSQLPVTLDFTQEQLDTIKRTIAAKATPEELMLFIETCKRTGLDPFMKQIYAIWRYDSKQQREVMQIQVGIDGFRLIAARSGKYAGQLGPFWSKDGMEWLDAWPYEGDPKFAKMSVLRKDFKHPLTAVCRWESYVQTDSKGNLIGKWADMPDNQLAVRAEALALRRAFPAEMMGLALSLEGEADTTYVDTETGEIMPAVIQTPTAAPQATLESGPAPEVIARLERAKAEMRTWDKEAQIRVAAEMKANFPFAWTGSSFTPRSMTAEQAEAVLAYLKPLAPEPGDEADTVEPDDIPFEDPAAVQAGLGVEAASARRVHDEG